MSTEYNIKWEQLRPVSFKKIGQHDFELGRRTSDTIIEGRFHCWGTKLASNQERITCAIIEDNEHKIHTVEPDLVIFLGESNMDLLKRELDERITQMSKL